MHRNFSNLPAGLAIPTAQNSEHRVMQNILTQIKVQFKDEDINKRVEELFEKYKPQPQILSQFCKALYSVMDNSLWPQLRMIIESEIHTGAPANMYNRYHTGGISQADDEPAEFQSGGFDSFVDSLTHPDRPRTS